MPLVRFEVRNEYGLGAAELYRGAKKDDSKAVVDGVAVAGMVGILRQLGDLAELAAEVFQGLQEQVMATAVRSHNMITRVQRMEEALPPLEKAVLAQKCHVHFAYKAGVDWHANIQPEQNIIVHSDVPQFIMDSYEECRGPPRLELLDKFDTSGPGACLKRYSDPSIFRIALASTDPVNIERVQGERRAQKVEKKGSRHRNLEVPHFVPISHHHGSSSRTQFAPATSFGQKLATETVSSFGMRSGSELGNRATSFDSKTMSDDMECAFNVSSSMQNKDLEHNELLTSRLKLQHTKAIGSVLPHKPIGGSHDVYSERSLQGDSINNSSGVNWVEKTEIVKSTNQGSENAVEGLIEASKPNTMHPDPGTLQNETTEHVNNGPEDILDNHQNIQESPAKKGQFKESANDPDGDTRVEVETTFDHQTMEGVADIQLANLKNHGKDGKDTMNGISAQNLAPFSINPSPSREFTNQNFAKSACLEDFNAKPPNALELPANIAMCGSTDMSTRKHLESATSDLASFGSNFLSLPNSLSDKSITSLYGPQESASKLSAQTSSKFWTNGGLLGLEPSKPSEGVVLSSASENHIPNAKADEQSLPNDTSIVKSHFDESLEKVETLTKSTESREVNRSFKVGKENSPESVKLDNVSPNELTRRMGDLVLLANQSECCILDHDKHGKSKESCSTCQISDAQGCSRANSCIKNPGPPTVPDVERPSSESNKGCVGSLTGTFGIIDGLNASSSETKVPFSLSEASNSIETSLMKLQDSHSDQQKGPNSNLHQASSRTNHSEIFTHESSTKFLPSSPPIQHMKISFNPVGRSETSKLKLKVSGEVHFSDSSRGFNFPSFQLLPEPAIQLKDIDYESDEETFNGSSQYMSDELMSQYSESSAEQWESGDIAGHESSVVYDALYRVSSVQSILGCSGPEGIANDSVYVESDYKSLETDNSIQTSHSGYVLDLPNFDAVDGLKCQKDKRSHISGNDLDMVTQHLNEQMPPPPPLPPLQWRVRKTQFDAVEDQEGFKSEDLNNPKHLQVPAFITFQHRGLDPPMQHVKEAAAFPSKIKQDRQKFNVNRDANLVLSGKDMDEKDLFHQIKTKTLNLRHTMRKEPTQKQNPTTDIKSTAILAKANAIRQAFVGSDEEEDDN